jgi:hypothetical protein
MFSLFNGIYDSYLAPSQLNLLIVGAPNAGKSALLERLKVTEIPTRPKSGTSGDNLHPQDLTQTLYIEFVETGAADIAGRRKSSLLKRNEGTISPEELNRRLAVVEAADSSTVASSIKPAVVTKPKRRFLRLNICPAPERYLKSAHDQDEDFEEDDHEEEQKELLASVDHGHSFEEKVRGELNAEGDGHDSFSDPPRRVRCHSKEFDVDSLDLMDGRRSSMQDIPLSSSPGKTNAAAAATTTTTSHNAAKQQWNRASSVQSQPVIQGPPLLQSSAEELYLKPNAKMLSMTKIRPTSECGIIGVLFLSSLPLLIKVSHFVAFCKTNRSWLQPCQARYVRRKMSYF